MDVLQGFFGLNQLEFLKNITDLKHRHLAGAFFLALVLDNNF